MNLQSLVVFWDTEEEAADEVAALLATLPDIDWTKPVFMCGCSAAVTAQFTEGRVRVGGQHSARVLWHMRLYKLDEASRLLQHQLPTGYYVSRLRTEDAATVHQHSKSKWCLSREGVEQLITQLPSAGVRYNPSAYGRSEDSVPETREDCLVSWSLLRSHGDLGMTYTTPEHRRQGLARAAIVALARIVLDEGRTPYVQIEVDNELSAEFHIKLGFKSQCEVKHVLYLPPGINEW